MIIFIIPKNSGLKSKTLEVLEQFNLKGNIIEVRGEDIPCFVSKLIKEGKKAVGITGEDLFREFTLNNCNTGIRMIKRIKWEDNGYLFKKPALCLLGPKEKIFEDFNKKSLRICINSKYKNLAKKGIIGILEGRGYRFEKVYASGATEEFFTRGIVDLVIDIVCSGKSAEIAGLKVYNKIFESDIVLIGKKEDAKNINFNPENMNFKKENGLIPTIVKDEQGNVLTLAYSTEESLKKAIEEKVGWYFSRSRNKLWKKGETSGNTQKLIKIKADCDRDSLLFVVKQTKSACHKNKYSCFDEEKKFSLQELYSKIKDRISSDNENSYTKKLIANPNELKRKLIEEAGEVITADSRENLIWECADLLYFLFVTMANENITIEDIEKENERRDKENLNKQTGLK